MTHFSGVNVFIRDTRVNSCYHLTPKYHLSRNNILFFKQVYLRRSICKWKYCIIKRPKGHKLGLNLNRQKKGRNTKIFYWIRKNKIKTHGKTSSSKSEILQEMCNFYENLYTSKSINDEKVADYVEKVYYSKLNTQRQWNMR